VVDLEADFAGRPRKLGRDGRGEGEKGECSPCRNLIISKAGTLGTESIILRDIGSATGLAEIWEEKVG
jgi:hypothetical protein